MYLWILSPQKSFKFQQLALFTIYPQMSCLGLNFLMSNIYFTRFLLQYHLGKKENIPTGQRYNKFF